MTKLTIDFNPRAAQQLILNKLNKYRFVVAICHRRLGKTMTAIYWLIEGAINTDKDDYRGYYFGVSKKSARSVSWSYFKKLLSPLVQQGLAHFRETELQAVFWNGSIIQLAGAENIESYRGIYIDRLVADEIASWSNQQYAYYEILRPALSDRNGRGLYIGTVKGLDMLYDFYQRGVSNLDMDNDFYAIRLPASITNIIPEKEIEELKYSMSENAYAREFECDFFVEGADILISPSEVDLAINRNLSVQDIEYSKSCDIIFGCDVGRIRDSTIIYKRQGLIAEKIFEKHIVDSNELGNAIAYTINKYKPVRVFIDASGFGPVDRLNKLGYEDIVIPVDFGSRSNDPDAFNKRAEIYNNLKKFIKIGKIPEDEQLRKELCNILLDTESDKIKLVKKSKIISAVGKSPDDADALALTCAEEFLFEDSETRKERLLKEYYKAANIKKSKNTYDPLNYMENRFDW